MRRNQFRGTKVSGDTYTFPLVLEEDGEFGHEGMLEGDEVEVGVPGMWEICSNCRGNGTHVHRAIDGNGITGSEWAEWDQDERETYLSGGYDVACDEGCIAGKVVVPDEDRCSAREKEMLERHYAQERVNAQVDAEDAYYRRMECGGY